MTTLDRDETEVAYEPPVPIELPLASPKTRVFRKVETAAVFARYLGPVLVKRVAKRPAPPAEVGRRLRLAFESLGSTYIKFGQLVGSSPGAFGAAVSDEFRSCLDTGPAVALDEIRHVIEAAVGCPLDVAFITIKPEPIASASIAAVYQATLPDGREVAVKVLRPGIAARVAVDLDIMEPVFKRLALWGVPIAGPLYRFLRGFRTQVAEELDLRNEARTMTHFRSLVLAGGLDRIVIPEPYPELSSADVLVMEFLDGVAIDDLGAIEEMGHDPRPVVLDLLRSWFLTGLRDAMFHGDIHAGNLMILRDGRAGVIDWGIVGRLDAPTHRLFRRFVEAILGDVTAWDEIAKFIAEMGGPFAGGDEGDGRGGGGIPEEARNEIQDMLTKPFGEVNLSGAFSGPGPVGERHKKPRTRAEKKVRRKFIREMRQRMIGSGFADTGLAQADFLLFKQLLYFERYGKMYLADTALMGDREYLEKVLAESPTTFPE